MNIILAIIAILIAYLLGSIPTSFIFAKLMKGMDIRDYGSGNVGATNLLRVTGKAPAILALFLDIVKGIVAVTLVPFIFIKFDPKMSFEVFRIILGLAAVFGHIWPVFLKFKGGKGVATSAGVLLIIAPKAVGLAILIWLLTLAVSRLVSLGAILASISLPVSSALMGERVEVVILCIILCLICCYKHKSNIKRLIRAEEPRLGEKVKKQ